MDGRGAWWMSQVCPFPATADGCAQTPVPMWFCHWCLPCRSYSLAEWTWVRVPGWEKPVQMQACDSAWELAEGTPLHIQICRWQLFSVSPMTDSRMILLNTLCHYLLLVTHHFANWQRAMEGFPLDCWALGDVLKRGCWLQLQKEASRRQKPFQSLSLLPALDWTCSSPACMMQSNQLNCTDLQSELLMQNGKKNKTKK